MDEYKNLLFEVEDDIMIVTINRPDRMNALNRETLYEGARFIKDLQFNKDVRAVIITGAGERAFCTGADLKERVTMDAGEVRLMVQAIRDTFTAIENLSVPVICAINGYALGGGLELALACDIRIASENAIMGLTETSLGIIPGGGGTQRLPRLIGRGKAKELILTAGRITATEAYEMGILNRVVPEGKALEASIEIAKKIAANGPVAVRQAKFAINRGMEVDIKTGLFMEASAYEACIDTEDRLEALAAFREKRKPAFKGK